LLVVVVAAHLTAAAVAQGDIGQLLASM